MREIKFRAWDKKSHRWLDFEKRNIALDPENGNLLQPGDGTLYLFDETDYDLQQFTGLKDKNGKDIYEGDILAVWESGWDGEANPDKKNYEVQWGGTDYPAFTLDGWEDGEMNAFSEINMSGDWECEVIGNIYENPELLK